MQKKFRSFFLLLTLFFSTTLAGCLTTAGLGPQFTSTMAPQKGQALIYVYRQQEPLTGANVPGVKMNGKVIVANLPDRNYFPIAVTPAAYTFTPKLFGIYSTTPVTVQAKAGKTYFVRLRVVLGQVKFELVPKSEALAYLNSCYLSRPSDALDSRVMVAGTGDSRASQKKGAKSTTTVTIPSSKLYVDAIPNNARIRIMNIKPKFHQGIELSAGSYKVEVTAVGFSKYEKWIKLGIDETRQLEVELQPL